MGAGIVTAVALVFGVLVQFRHTSKKIPSALIQHVSSREIVPTFAGADACASCHRAEFDRWQGSHHQLAMQAATDATVLGDFNQASFTNRSVTSTFFKRAGKFIVRTDGPDNLLHDYEVSFTFGIYPLQQYLIAMPSGRLQALGLAWDSRTRAAGGQRWFFLYPNQKIAPSAPLHWTGIDQTWNHMCADCHSTNLRKNYDLRTRTYKTTYAEINVACEACHGPGSNHIRWASKRGDWKQLDSNEGLTIALNERKGAAWIVDPLTGNPQRTTPRTSEREIQMCARCHARRGQIAEDYVHGQPLGDDYRVALLEPELYFPDGQIKGEVYEYGSFIQSRMYHEGVTCSDCHEPHSLKLRAEGNNVCLQCHAARYDSPAHHLHRSGSAGAQCVNCHMPSRTYMVIDVRRDHSLRIPRPDLSLSLGTPNACNQCHRDKTAQWSAATITKWYGHAPSGFQHFAETLARGREGVPAAQSALESLVTDYQQPAIARATALTILADFAPVPTDPGVEAGVKDTSSLVRRAVTEVFSHSNLNGDAEIPGALLQEPVRAVRIDTGALLAGDASLPPGLSASLERAIDEYIAAQELDADRPEAHLNLGALFVREGQVARAEDELKTALSLDPTFAPAAVNLADLYRMQDRDADGAAVLGTALRQSPDNPALLHALGLLMVREQQSAQALDLLAAAARLAPANARYAYVYAIALNDMGKTAVATKVLETNLESHPYDRDSLAAVANLLEQAGDSSAAMNYRHRLEELAPANQ